MGCRVPKLVFANISLLMPHLGGKAYSLRSAIVATMGHILHKGFPEPQDAAQDEGAPGEAASPGPSGKICWKMPFTCVNLLNVHNQEAAQDEGAPGEEASPGPSGRLC